ncbi:anthranilate synthase component II [Sphingomicrobium sediminis]|uniref:anthranilate synthase n=1 Tax=Sphingomicrobium sediminis TaxID=2950949 RepID=A0A9X2J2R9_9SPHN|nr:aminodeoxychorismate/anthranilate synthase component II [Sphingomicrobium sediminis]MCM8558054.1 aminodeoxychorismate/anthranilate synthase component II [Sphingomicrobium sediminis]
MRLTFIDNRDSFTFNLVDAFTMAGADVQVVRNSISVEKAHEIADGGALLISPGPGTPADAGCIIELCKAARGRIPLIGVCLGHQAIVEAAGGTVERAPEPIHGKVSHLVHDGGGVLAGLPSPLAIGRYHSLCTPLASLPDHFTVDAAHDGMAMVVRDEPGLQIGLQFHPESILTPRGDRLVAGLIDWARAAAERRQAA